MSLIVDEKHELRQVSTVIVPKQPTFVRVLATILSYVFHPLFIPIYLVYFLIKIHPYFFAGFSEWQQLRVLFQVILNCTFLPLVSVLLLRGLRFIDTIHLRTQKERILPYVIIMVFYFWNWYVFKNNQGMDEVTMLSMAIFIGCIMGFMSNIYFKISMHAIAMGVATAFIWSIAYNDSSNLTLYLVLTILISGLVCTSRLIVSDHSPKEIYLGFVFGVVAVVLASYFT